MEFCAISPTSYLQHVSGRPVHLVLAHLVETNKEYTEFYLNESRKGSEIILDNSAFEMFKQGRPMYDSNKLIAMGKAVEADYIVLSDYPNEDGINTINAAKTLIPEFKANGFKTFFVPQSKIGNLDDYLHTWKWAAENTDIDLIGLSILGAPNAFGVEKNNQLQRYLSRSHILDILNEKGILEKVGNSRIHALGMVDGPNEVKLLMKYKKHIKSIDSSSPFWHGILGISYDKSPTGLILGKNETEVDFDITYDKQKVNLMLSNLEIIDKMLT